MRIHDRFSEIKELLNLFQRSELEALYASMEGLSKIDARYYRHGLKIIQKIQAKPDISQSACLKSVGFSEKRKGETNILLLSLRNVLLEHFQLDINIERPGSYSNAFRTRNTNSARLQTVRILLSRSCINLPIKLLEEVNSRSEKYELFDQQVEALKLMQLVESCEKGLRTFNRLQGDLDLAMARRQRQEEVEAIHRAYAMHSKRGDHHDLLSKQKSYIKQLDKLSSGKYAISMAAYARLSIELDMQVEAQEWKAAERTAKKLMRFVSGSPAIHSRERMADGLQILVRIEMQLRKFKEALDILDSLEGMVMRSSYEGYLVNKYRCLCLFHLKDYASLSERIPKILKSKFTQRLPFAVVQFHYYQAVLAYLNGDHRQAIKQLSHSAFEKAEKADKLSFHAALVEVYAAVELLDGDHKAMAQQSLDKCLSRLQKEAPLSQLNKRSKNVLRMVDKLAQFSFDFKKTGFAVERKLQQMLAAESAVAWNPMSDELIPFEQWMQSKIKDKALKVRTKLPQKEKKTRKQSRKKKS